MAKIDEGKLLQISKNFIFVNWQGVVEILNLHRKWKNEKNEKHSSLPNSITERTMFLKMQNFAAFKSLRISTTEKEKEM